MGLTYSPARRTVTFSLDLEAIDNTQPQLTQCTLEVATTDRFLTAKETAWVERANDGGLYAHGSDVEDFPKRNIPYVFDSWEAALQVFSTTAIGSNGWALHDVLLGYEVLVPEFGSPIRDWKPLAYALPPSGTMPIMAATGHSVWLCFLATGVAAAGSAAMACGNAIFVRVILPTLDAIGDEAQIAARPAARTFFKRVLRLPASLDED
ncbi:hypothetical protein [Kitasatospora aureofaciens]|uniref:hypothetical protein n=1 Tax=Kitasatospora aureofaciens TaxID=1894 RepID=UPI00382EE6F0